MTPRAVRRVVGAAQQRGADSQRVRLDLMKFGSAPLMSACVRASCRPTASRARRVRHRTRIKHGCGGVRNCAAPRVGAYQHAAGIVIDGGVETVAAAARDDTAQLTGFLERLGGRPVGGRTRTAAGARAGRPYRVDTTGGARTVKRRSAATRRIHL